MPPVIEYQFSLTDVYNLIAHGKYLCQNYVYLSPQIYVLSFVCVQKNFRDFIFNRKKTIHMGSGGYLMMRTTIKSLIDLYVCKCVTIKMGRYRI